MKHYRVETKQEAVRLVLEEQMKKAFNCWHISQPCD